MRQAADQGLRRDQLLRDLIQLLGRQVEKPIAVEERATIRLADMREQLRLGSHLISELRGGLLGEMGGTSINDGDKQGVVLRKRLVEGLLVLPAGDISRQSAHVVGIDG